MAPIPGCHCPPFASPFCGFSHWKELGFFFQWWLDPKSPKDAKGSPRAPLGFGLFWVFFKVLTTKSFHLLGKQCRGSHKTANPGNSNSPNSAPCKPRLLSVPRTAAAPGESERRWSSTQNSPAKQQNKPRHYTWQGISREVEYSMKNINPKIKPSTNPATQG